MNKPKRLKYGDTIGLVAPASPASERKLKKACDKLKEMGFNIVVGKTCYSKDGYLAGSDKLRAEEINYMFGNREIDGIICLRGGYGTLRILDLLDFEVIKMNPKVFVGYSDITALHIAFNQLADLVTFHGPMAASDIAEDFSDFSKESLLNSIFNKEFNQSIKNPTEEIITINSGIAEGSIIGGNLSLIVSTLGTPYEIDTRSKILFIEEIKEEPYKIDRMLNQLKLSKKLEDAEGIILGDFNDCDAKGEESLTLEEVIKDIIKPLKKPTIYNLKAGHCKPMLTIPLGVKVRLDATKKEVVILEKPTI